MEQSKINCFKTSWSRLETALNIDDSYVFTDSRPKTTASGRKNSPSSRNPKLHIFRTPSACRSCRNRLKRQNDVLTARTTVVVPGLTFPQVQLLYSAKCEDLGIPILPDQEKRFFKYCFRNFQNRSLKLHESGIGISTASALGEIMRTSTYFAYLDLSKNLLKDLGAVRLASSLQSSLTIVHLDISSNEISPEGARDVFRTLNSHQSLASIDISSHEGLHRNRLGPIGAEAVGICLRNSLVLSVLNLAGTCIGPDGISFIVHGLEGNQSLSSLDLSNNGLGYKSIEKLAKVLVRTDVRDLNLAYNKIGNDACEALGLMMSGGFNGFCVLEKLDLTENEINSDGLGKLLAALRINSQLSSLNLKKNDFSMGISSHMHQFLCENASLKSLTLSHCQISCDHLSSFPEGLSKNNGLVHLNLSYNKISDKGVNFISQGLIKNSNLKTLDLSTNLIKEKGALALVRSMQDNNSLKELNLKNNSIKNEGASKLSELTRWKKNIMKLNLNLNPCNLKFIEIIKINLKSNFMHQRKLLIPKLHEAVSKLHFKDSAFDELLCRINQKEKERIDIETKVKATGGKLDEIKLNEEQKLAELKSQYEGIREVSIKLSHEIEELNFQLNVVGM